MRRLRRRYPEASDKTDIPIALQKRLIPQGPATNEVPEFKKRIISRAQIATGVSAEDVAIILAVQATAVPAGSGAEGDPEKGRELVSTAVETLEQIKPEGPLQFMLAV